MHSASNKVADSSKRLSVRLMKTGQPERVLEFPAGHDAARVVGRASSSDVVLGDAGVLPVHCYFEREHDDIWLSAAQGEAVIRVNYQPVLGRTKLSRRCIVELGEARLQVVVLEEDEGSPSHGPFGTELIDVRAFRVAADLFETTRVDAHVALGNFPTSAWQKLDADESTATTTATPRNGELEGSAKGERSLSAVASPSAPSSDATPLVDTVRIRRTAVLAKQGADQGPSTAEARGPGATLAPPRAEPVQPSRCILIEARNRLVAMPTIVPGEPSGGDVSTPSHLATPHPPAFELARVTFDAGSFTTIGQPIADVLTAEPPQNGISVSLNSRLTARRTSLRQRFAVGLGRDPRVVAGITIYAVLSLVTVAAQTVRAWPYFVERPVVGSSGTQASERAMHPYSQRDAAASLMNGSPILASSTSVTPPGDQQQTSAGDPLVAQAVNHLLLGREAEAAGAYAALASRYPGEPVYAATAKVLRRRLNPACQQGNEIQCGKALP
jgi:hypothetical protein